MPVEVFAQSVLLVLDRFAGRRSSFFGPQERTPPRTRGLLFLVTLRCVG
jgi:hypothetical protein